ncbi:PP2C family serine/threonine-protein phosphatase [Hydrogenophaga soli]
MMFEFSSATDPGRVRENNEDAVAFDEVSGVAVLADGMGGYNAGEIASAMAVTYVRTEASHWLQGVGARAADEDVRRALEQCVARANLSIYNAAMANTQYSGMGTTIVAGVFDPRRVILAHVGDSRCYLLREGRLTQLTRDHSLLQEQIDAGLISLEQAKVATHKNLVTRALGVDTSVQVDVQQHLPREGDLYLMCSDGLTDMVDDSEIQALLTVPGTLQDQAHALVREANGAGGRDNISVLLVQVRAKSEPLGLFARMLRKP